MRHPPRPHPLRCLAGVLASVFALVMMSVVESILEVSCKRLHAPSCGALPDPLLYLGLAAVAGGVVYSAFKAYRDFISGDYDRDVMRSMGWL